MLTTPDPDDRTPLLELLAGPAGNGLSLLVIGHDEIGRVSLPDRGDVVIGRSPRADVRIDVASLSRRHARLRITQDAVTIQDMNSANGTFVAGVRLQAEEIVELDVDGMFALGSAMFVLSSADREPSKRLTRRRSRSRANVSPRERLAAAKSALKTRPGGPNSDAQDLVVAAATMKTLHKLVARVAASSLNIMLLGETGVGKEVFASKIHTNSPRAKGPLLRLNCAALSETLIESQLFGHVRGAFTGADSTKSGLLESASGGTVFLDEIGDMPLPIQAKLLRVLEDRQVRRVGSTESIDIDIRVIAATHRDLEREITEGRFRQDLFFRLNGFAVTIPPLRSRRSEILPLARYFMAQSARSSDSHVELSPEACTLLQQFDWPGNVRQLRNAIERAMVLCDSRIDPAHLPPAIQAALDARNAARPVGATQHEPQDSSALRADRKTKERALIVQALADSGGNQTRAAKALGISRGTLIARLDAYGIPRPRKNQRRRGPR